MKNKPENFPTGTEQCQGCEGPCENHNAVTQRQNTKYANDESNWVTFCPECAAANAEYWDERWAEFYSGRL